MDFEAIAQGLLDLVSTLTGVERSCCLFENDPRVQHNGALVLLRWVGEASVGVDSTHYTFAEADDPLDEMTPTTTGNRVLTLQVDVEVHDQRPGVNAHAVASRARTRLAWPSTIAALEDLDLAVATVEGLVTTDYEVDGHFVSRRSFDVRLHATAREVDAAGATSSIDTIEAEATIRHPDDTVVAASIAPGGTLP